MNYKKEERCIAGRLCKFKQMRSRYRYEDEKRVCDLGDNKTRNSNTDTCTVATRTKKKFLVPVQTLLLAVRSLMQKELNCVLDATFPITINHRNNKNQQIQQTESRTLGLCYN
jgi:hypothetical protein